MSSPLIKDNGKGIINPFAKMVLTLSVDDQGQVSLNSPLHPREVCKLLRNIETDLLFQYMNASTKVDQQTDKAVD